MVDVVDGVVVIEAPAMSPMLIDASGCRVAAPTAVGFDLFGPDGVEQVQTDDVLAALAPDGSMVVVGALESPPAARPLRRGAVDDHRSTSGPRAASCTSRNCEHRPVTGNSASDDSNSDELIEIVRDGTVWRFERAFLESNWTCLFGQGCKGILDHDATALNQGCCSLGAHFGDGPAGEAEAMTVDAYASMLTPEQFQYHEQAHADPDGIFGDAERSHTRVIDGACIFLNRPGWPGGEGCALPHRGGRIRGVANRVEAVGVLAAAATDRLERDRRHHGVGHGAALDASRLGHATARRWHGVAPSGPRAPRPTPVTIK